jgi:hypothetical protein
VARERKYVHGDRVRRLSDGRDGRVIDVHPEAQPEVRLGVLLDGDRRLTMLYVSEVERR